MQHVPAKGSRYCQADRPAPGVSTRRHISCLALVILMVTSVAAGAVERRLANDGQLILEDIPPIPPALAERLDLFQQLRSNAMLAWTGDGKQLYVRSRFEGVNQVQLIDRARGVPTQLTRLPEPVREVVRQHAGELLAFTMDHGGSGLDQIYLLDPQDGAVRQLTDTPGALNNRVVWDYSGRQLAFRSTRRNGAGNDLWLMAIDAPAEARLILAVDDGALWKPVAFSRDDRLLLVQQYSGVTDSRIHLLDLETGALREVVGMPGVETSNVAVAFDADDTGVFFVSNQRGRAAEIGWAPLDPAGEVRWLDSNIAWDITDVELSPDGHRGAFLTNESGLSRLYLFDTRRFRFREASGIPVGVASDLQFSPDGRRLALTISTPTSPGDVYVITLSRLGAYPGRPKQWTSGGVGDLRARDLVVPALGSFPAPGLLPDSVLNIPLFIYRPRGRGPHPVVIYIHGGPESQFRPDFNATVQMWASDMGVAVLAPNVRGSLGYGGGYLSLDDGRQRESAVRDIGALLDWIATQDDLDETRVAVFGASYGGYMALASAVHYSDRLVGAVDRAGISNFVSYLENTADFRRDLRRFEYGDERDPEMRAFLESISPLNNVDRISIPLLIVQGQNDPVVPVSESEQMVAALRARGQTVWYLNALNEGHGYEKKENRDVYQQVTYLFLQRYLLGP